jgi:acetyl esterase/lipase
MHRFMGKSAGLWAAALALWPQAAAAQRAGTLVSAQPVDDAPAGARAWRVQYWTTDDRNQPIRVTGMVIAPKDRTSGGPRRVIAWAHGLIGIAQRCAPSLGAANFTTIPTLGEAIRRGYTVVAPDYPGLGSDMVHPVLVGTSEGRSVLDAVRAARGIREADAGSRFAVWGESQGGHAALWTGQLWRGYAPDLQLVGIAAIVPPTDLHRNFKEGSDPRVRALLTAYTATSWSRHYGASMSIFGSRTAQNTMIRLADNNCVQFNARPKLGTILGIAIVQHAIRTLDLGAHQPWARLMRENSPSPAAIPVPALIATGTGDTIVAPAVVHDFARRACALGKTVRYLSVKGGEHATVARTEAQATLGWLDARFAGQRAPSSCNAI